MEQLSAAMPLYELFCLSASRLSQAGLKEIMKKTGRIILSHNGVITDVKSFGEKKLAYCIRRPGERHSTALLWQVTFASGPETVGDIEQGLRLDEDVIRWTVLKRLQTERLPSSYRVAELARKELGRN